jgi:hypothetical protein
MARKKRDERPSLPETTPSSGWSPRSTRISILILAASASAAVWATAMLTAAGRVAYAYVFFFLNFYAGVFILLTLTGTVVAGLLATDRIVLQVRHRVLLQFAHRVSGTMAVIFLALHIIIKISIGSAAPIDAAVPFLAANRPFYVGLGTVASYLMLSVFWTGIVRARFAENGRPWMWRALHSMAYFSWPVSILHGLRAGRAAASWVTVSYVVAIGLVAVALLVRLASRRPKGKGGITTTGSIKPIGKPVTLGPSVLRTVSEVRVAPASREAPERRPAQDEIVIGGLGRRRAVDDDIPVGGPGRRLAAEDDIPVGGPSRRLAAEEELAAARWSAGERSPAGAGRRRSVHEEPVPEPPRVRRRAVEEEPAIEAPRRWSPEERPIWGAGRRRAIEEEPVADVRQYWPPQYQDDEPVYGDRSSPLYASGPDYPPGDDTPTLVDMAARRALRAATDRAATDRAATDRAATDRAATDPNVPASRSGRRRPPPETAAGDQYWVS